MYRNQKHQDFVTDPIIKYKSVDSLPGIGVVHGGHLKESGFGSAISVLQQFLYFKQNERLFTEWLRSTSGVSANFASMCFNGLREWYETWGAEYAFKVTAPSEIGRQKSPTPIRFDERSPTPKIHYQQNNIFMDFFPNDRLARPITISSNSLLDITRDPWQSSRENELKRRSMPRSMTALQEKAFDSYANMMRSERINNNLSTQSSTYSRSLTPERSPINKVNNNNNNTSNFAESLSKNMNSVGTTKPFITSVKEYIRGGSGTDRQTSVESSTISNDSIEENEPSDKEEENINSQAKEQEEVKPLQRAPTFILDSGPMKNGENEERTSGQEDKATDYKPRNSLSNSTSNSDQSKVSNSSKTVRYADIDTFDDRQDIRNIKPVNMKLNLSKENKHNNLNTKVQSSSMYRNEKYVSKPIAPGIIKKPSMSMSTPNLNVLSTRINMPVSNMKSSLRNTKNTSKSTMQLRSFQPVTTTPKIINRASNFNSTAAISVNSMQNKRNNLTNSNVNRPMCNQNEKPTIKPKPEMSVKAKRRTSTSAVEQRLKQTENINLKTSTSIRSTSRHRMSPEDSGVSMKSKKSFKTFSEDATTDSDRDSTTLSGSIASYQKMRIPANNVNKSKVMANGFGSSNNFPTENSADEDHDRSTDWSTRDELESVSNKRRNVRLFCDLLSSEMEQLPMDKIRVIKAKILQLVYAEIEKHETEQNSQA